MAGRETSAEIDGLAVDWAARADAAPLDARAQAELDAWLDGDSRHLGAYARARAMFHHAQRAKALGPEIGHGTGKPVVPMHDVIGIADHYHTAATELTPSRRRFLIGGGAVAAASAAAMLGVSWQAAAETYSTKLGEIRRIPLSDGSAMTLNTSSAARIRFADDARRVELIEGEALFDVAKDVSRPFIVTAGDTQVSAIGTSFSVSRIATTPVAVVVRQGVVEIQRLDQRNVIARAITPERAVVAQPERISANMQAVVAPSAPLVTMPVSADEMRRALAWRDGMLSFEEVPLSAAADQFARYSDVHIRFADHRIGQQNVTGLFAANDPVAFARAVASGLGLRAQRVSDDVVLTR